MLSFFYYNLINIALKKTNILKSLNNITEYLK